MYLLALLLLGLLLMSKLKAPGSSFGRSAPEDRSFVLAVQPEALELPALASRSEDEELCELPRRLPVYGYSEKASAAEMTFAGHYLNLLGILLITLGGLASLHVSGRVSGGALPSLLGLLLGGGLLVSGHRLHRRGERAYAEPLLAGGGSILLLSVVGAHFHYHVLGLPAMAAALFALLGWSGWAVLAYDSRLIGNGTLAVLFLAPLGLHTSLVQTLVYLITINVATSIVAFYKRWDFYRIVCFLATYALYFSQVAEDRPGVTLAFLGLIYLLFVVSNNLFQKATSHYDLPLAFINPLAFAVTSYAVMLHLPSVVAPVVHLSVGLLHLGLARHSWNRRLEGPAFEDITTNNLTLGLLFVTSAISFVPYFSVDTDYFWLVTALWFGEALALVLASRRSQRYELLLQRAAYLCGGLATTQLFWVVSTLDPMHIKRIDLGAALAYLGLYLVLRPSRQQAEVRGAMTACWMTGMILLAHLAFTSPYPVPCLNALICVALCWSLMERAVLGPLVLAVGASEAMLVTLPWDYPSRIEPVAQALALLTQAAILLWAFPTRIPQAARSPLACAAVALALVSAIPSLLFLSTTHVALAVGLAALALSWASWREELLRPLVRVSYLLGIATFVLTFGSSSWVLQAAVAAAFLSARWVPQRESAVALAVGMGLRAAMALSPTSPGTALWCGLGLALLAAGKLEDGRAVLVLAFLKAVVMDANFGVQQALTMTVSPLQLAGMLATVAAFVAAARITRESHEARNLFTVFGLTTAAFHSSLVLYVTFGVLDEFQVILSGFWMCASILLIAQGIWAEVKVYRLFGLTLLSGCVLKVYVVDLWVLSAYSQVTTTIVLGTMLLMVSCLYQTNRGRLQLAPQAA